MAKERRWLVPELSNTDGLWDEFVDWLEDHYHASLADDSWKPFWDCWQTAILKERSETQ